MPDLPMARGVRDLLPNAALFMNEALDKIERVFQRFGFLTIDTPAIESLKVLKAKGGIGEEAKLIFELKDDELGLGYDQTVSLARYMVMHQELPLPFKRYAIGKAWRREEPQHLRYRELTQADVDIVGGDSMAADAEVIATAAAALEELGFEYNIRVSSRKVMDGVLASFGVKSEMAAGVMRAIDKLDKLGLDGVIEALLGMGIDRDVASRIDKLLGMQGSNEEKLGYLSSVVQDKKAVEELGAVLDTLKAYNLRGNVNVDLSVVRGLDYYTGIVFEYMDASGAVKASLGGGGRYDNLIALYGGRSLPAVGVALGVDRIMDLLGYESSIKYTNAKLFMINVKESNYRYSIETANWFRSRGVATDVNLAARNISNQLAYANSLKFGYAAIVGDVEEKAGKVKLRNLASGEEIMLTREEAFDILVRGA